MITFRQLKQLLKTDVSDLPKTNIALMADFASQFYKDALQGHGIGHQANYSIWESDYNQIEQQLLDPHSTFHSKDFDVVIVLRSVQHLWQAFVKTSIEERPSFWSQHLQSFQAQINAIDRTKTSLIISNYEEFDDEVFGQFANKTTHAFLYQLRILNVELMKLVNDSKNTFLLDLLSLQIKRTTPSIADNKLAISASIPHHLDHIALIGSRISDLIEASKGNVHKCLILDLDNTLWGGIIGDDGIENIELGDLGIGKAFTRLQSWAKLLKDRGIILAVCSKNEESTAKKPFESHPDMVLRLEDIAVFIANWEPKSENIKRIQQVLNIGFDSMVFIDDNPAEREEVRQALPTVTVPELPVDPVDYLDHLLTLNLFETTNFSGEDSARTEKYQQESKRISAATSFKDPGDFLQSLSMKGTIEGVTPFNIPRISQLAQRSNQYNFRTVRYSEEDISQLSSSANHEVLALRLSDKFGEYGLICVVVLELRPTSVFIENWMMSCRVLKRGVEHVMLNAIVDFAQKKGLPNITGEYVPSSKNMIVKNFFPDYHFKQVEGLWQLDVHTYIPQKHYVKLED